MNLVKLVFFFSVTGGAVAGPVAESRDSAEVGVLGMVVGAVVGIVCHVILTGVFAPLVSIPDADAAPTTGGQKFLTVIGICGAVATPVIAAAASYYLVDFAIAREYFPA